jgi:hypothetical protein
MTIITTPSSLALVPSLETAWQDVDSSFERKLDLPVIQIDGLHISNELVLIAALGIDGEGHKHPLALIEGATENATVVQALIDNLIERGLDPKACRLFIIDGARALSKVIRRSFGAHTPIQRCQLHKARNVIERLPSRCMRRYAGRCGRPGSSTMLIKPSGCCAISPVGLTRRRPVSPPASSKGSTRC